MRWRATASISARSARRKTHGRRIERLKAQGITDAELARIHAPIGLDIGAVSPPEIAVAIMGEITARLRQRPEGAPEGAGEGVMKFGAVPVAEAEGAIAVHSIRQGGLVLKKGTLIGKAEIAALEAAGIAEIVVARLEPGDVSEDAAAAEIAAAVAGEGVRVDRAFTGRANLFAEQAGVLVVDKDAIDRLNQVDESITFATLAGLQAGGRRRDDRDREDHPVRGREQQRATRRSRWCARQRRWSGSRPIASARSASSRPCCRGWPARSSTRRSR